jgi:signal transduction histidine kinase
MAGILQHSPKMFSLAKNTHSIMPTFVEIDKPAPELQQINTLLEESRGHLLSRNLKKALNAAQIACDFANQFRSEADLLQANLLLASIYSINGRYLSDDSFFAKAKNCLAEVAHHVALREHNLMAQYLHTKGLVHMNCREFAEAKAALQEAIRSCGDQQTMQVQLHCDLSHAAMLEGDYLDSYELVIAAHEILHTNPDLEKNKALYTEVLNQLSQILVKRNDYSHALEYAQRVLQLSREQRDAEKELSALNTIAIVSGVKSNYKIAMQYFQESLDKGEAIGARDNIAHCLVNIGTIYAHLYNYEDALARYQQVLTDYADIIDDYTHVVIYNNAGNIHYTTGQFARAREQFEKAIAHARAKNFREELALGLSQLSRTQTALGDLELAESLAIEAGELIRSLGNINSRQINLTNQGDIFFRKGNTEKALELVGQGIEAAELLHDDASKIKAYKLLADIHHQAGNLGEAFASLEKYARLQEEFLKVQQGRQFLDLEIRNTLREKQREVEQLTRENVYQALLLEKSDQIERQNQELMQMNDDLKQFAYVASHDLKEPLRMMSSYAQILQRMLASHLDDNQRTYFGYINEGASRMNALLDALLRYATVGRSEEEMEPVELDYAVEVSKINLQVLVRETGAHIEYEALPEVVTIKSLLIQLLQNLISNAIKFRREGVTPHIHIGANDLGAEFEISVQDNGIGIAREHLDRIFVIFQRLHPRSRFEGTGIGLAICQRIVQRLGGRIWAESVEGQGSTFRFALPKIKVSEE